MMNLRRGIVGLCGVMLFCWVYSEERANAANWPRFRGPNGTGIVDDKDFPVEWNNGNILWKVPIPGTGNGSPIVWGERIFLQTAPAANQRHLLCLSTADGKVLWKQSIAGAGAKTHARNTLASSTPATDGERVYTTFWDGNAVHLLAYDFEGKEVWKRALGAFKSQHGFGASPIVYDGKVILNNDQDEAAQVIALDAKTGKDSWRAPRQAHRACYSTPFVIEQQGGPELVVTSTGGITAYNPKTGAEIWHWSWTFDGMALRTVGSAVFAGEYIFAQSGDGKGDRHAVGIKKGVKGDVTKTNLLWENKKSLPYVPCMLPKGDHVYFVNDKGFAGCVESKSGKMVWFERLGAGFTASPVMIDGKIYAPSEEGEVHVFLADPTFKVLAKNTIGEGAMASPAFANGRLYIRGKSSLFCIGKPSGK